MVTWLKGTTRKFTIREKSLLALLAVAVAVFAWVRLPRHWSAAGVVQTEHYAIQSSATEDQTCEIGQVAEIVYAGYRQLVTDLHQPIQPHPRLGIKLFKDREEFRRCNGVYNWAEAFYRPPYCYQYYSADELHPYHWMMHEATHQLNAEAAHLHLAQWLDEGLACYICTSRIVDGSLRLGEIDTNTYPVWWLDTIKSSGNLDADKKNGTIIPLRAIVSGQGGPSLSRHFNLYYLHWWSLTHFLLHYEDGQYRPGLSQLIAEGGSLPAFEKHLGPIEAIERQWYAYLAELQKRTAQATPPVRLKAGGGRP